MLKTFLGYVVLPTALLWAIFSLGSAGQDPKPTAKGETAVVPFKNTVMSGMR